MGAALCHQSQSSTQAIGDHHGGYRHRVGIKSPVSKVYAALSTIDGMAGWWTTATTGSPKVGGVIAFRFRTENGDEIGGFDMGVLELVPDQKVRWRVKAGPAEWVATEIEFSSPGRTRTPS